jgi:hypothetical protein
MSRIGDSLYCTGENQRVVKSFLEARQADDMDLLVNPTIENSGRIVRALTNIGIRSHGRNSFAKLGVQATVKQARRLG